MKKVNRKEVHARYDGHCAYCGQEISLNQMEVDHLVALRRGTTYGKGTDCITNKMPACRPCNRAKKSMPLESWRKVLENKLKELDRDVAAYRAAKRFGLVKENPQPVKFYFETV